MIETLTAFFQPWSDVYSDSAWIPTAVLAVHVLALFAGGGIAIAADRRLLLATPGTREAYLAAAEDLRTTHSVVIAAIVIMVLSGLALATSDIGTFAGSKVFWAKMASFALLIANGVYMRRTESRVLAAASDTGLVVRNETTPRGEPHRPWIVLKRSAAISLTAWCTIVLLGVVLSDI